MKRSLLPLLLWVLLSAPGVCPDRAGGEALRRFVLAAGVNNGGVERELLRYAVSDAENVARVFREMGGVDAADCIVLRNPDRAGLETGLEALSQSVSAARRWGAGRLEVVVYYSGHADDVGLLLAGQHKPYAALRQFLQELDAEVRIAILDACASGTITRAKGGSRQPPFLVDESASMRGYVFLTSSSEDEAAQESDQLRASFFTHYLVSGLRGAADVSQDGRVTLDEAYRFAFEETLARTTGTRGGVQHPSRDIHMAGAGDVVMTDLRHTAARLSLAADLDGRFFIRDDQGVLLAELRKPAGRTVEIGLHPGRFAVHWADGDRLLTTRSEVVAGRRLELAAAAFAPTEREATRSRGREGPPFSAGIGDRLNLDISAGDYTVSLALFYNCQEEAFRGLQAAWLVNQAHRQAGAQLGAIGNLAQDELRGWQAAGMVNWAVGAVQGHQLAGAVNIGRQVRGWQVSLGTNVAQALRGGQIVAGANFARALRGLQLGLLNAADRVRGWQVGLVNVSGNIDGVSLGIVNYSHSGPFNLGLAGDELGFTSMTLRSGSRRLYSAFSVGRRSELTAVGLGFGSHLSRGRHYAELELELLGIFRNSRSPGVERNQLTRLRANLGRQLDPHLSLYAGLSLNGLNAPGDPVLVEPYGNQKLRLARGTRVWPGITAGLRLGRQ